MVNVQKRSDPIRTSDAQVHIWCRILNHWDSIVGKASQCNKTETKLSKCLVVYHGSKRLGQKLIFVAYCYVALCLAWIQSETLLWHQWYNNKTKWQHKLQGGEGDNMCNNLNMKICGNSPRSHIAVWTVLSQRGLESLWWYGWSLWGSEPTGIRGNQISVSPECWSRNQTQRKQKLIYKAKMSTIHWHASIYLHKGVKRFSFKPASWVAVMTALWCQLEGRVRRQAVGPHVKAHSICSQRNTPVTQAIN